MKTKYRELNEAWDFFMFKIDQAHKAKVAALERKLSRKEYEHLRSEAQEAYDKVLQLEDEILADRFPKRRK